MNPYCNLKLAALLVNVLCHCHLVLEGLTDFDFDLCLQPLVSEPLFSLVLTQTDFLLSGVLSVLLVGGA